jgi:hypothetical protein
MEKLYGVSLQRMDRAKKLRLSADGEFCHCFKHGMFARLYERSLHWFSVTVKQLKPMLERVKDGEPVLYGGLPITSFEKLLEEDTLLQVEHMDYGWRWTYAAQTPLPKNTPEFDEWRIAALVQAKADATGRHPVKPCGRDVLAELAAFNLATHTPMQAMTFIAGWQEILRNGEGTG